MNISSNLYKFYEINYLKLKNNKLYGILGVKNDIGYSNPIKFALINIDINEGIDFSEIYEQ